MKIKAYHGSYTNIKKFKKEFCPQGVFWFSENKNSILSGIAGALSTKWIIEVELDVNKTASRKDYEKLTLWELKQNFDSVKLEENWVIFDSKNIKIIKGIEQ